MSIAISRSYKYVDYTVSAPSNRGYLTIDTSSWIDKPWMFYELPALKFEIYTESGEELLKYKNFTREIRTYNPIYSPSGVLNVTIDIRNVPEEFILRITPIFDNDAISARNMLIENGIEDGEIWGKDQDIPTQSFDLDIEFIECSGEYIPPVTPTHEETITGVPPITFDGSTGDPLVSWTILGNGEQTGTPSPDNIIMPTFCGVRTGNLAPPLTDWVVGYVNSVTGTIHEPSTAQEKTSPFINIKDIPRNHYLYMQYEGGEFPSGSSGTPWTCIGYYDEEKAFISRPASTGGGTVKQYTMPENAAYCLLSFRTYGETGSISLSSGISPSPYEPYGWAEKITCTGQTVPVYLGQTQTVRRIRKLVFDGTENWLIDTVDNAKVLFFINLGTVPKVSPVCTHYAGSTKSTWVSIEPNTITASVVSGGSNRLVINDNNAHTTKDDFKAWLADEYTAGHPVTVWYVLSEPETGIINEPLAKIGTYCDELSSEDAAVTIPTVRGENTLTVGGELQPSEMMITYLKNGE